jgi:hypothetical protein
VPGFAPWHYTLPLPHQAGFRDTFACLDIGTVRLRRRPAVLEVTTFELDQRNRPVPLGGVDVRVTAVWRRVAGLGGPGAAAGLLSFPLGVSQHWPTGTALDSVSLLPANEPVRRLVRGAAPGDRRIAVDRIDGLSVGDLLGLDLAGVDRREYLLVAFVDGPVDVLSPADIVLSGPVRTVHRDGTTARRVPPPAAAPADATVTEPAWPGDTTVFVTSTAPFGTVEVLRAGDPAIDDEYLDSHLFRATTDGGGFARMPALSRVAAVEITATRGPLSATARCSPDYRNATTPLALTLTGP